MFAAFLNFFAPGLCWAFRGRPFLALFLFILVLTAYAVFPIAGFLLHMVVVLAGFGSSGQPEEPSKSPAPMEITDKPGTKLTPLPGGDTVHVVGESHYQRALERIAGRRTDESKKLATTAVLRPEPTNRFDPNAVAIYIQERLVGYLSREDAVEFKPILTQLTLRGEVGTCDAVIVGGWDRGSRGKGSYGVKLSLSRPGRGGAKSDAEIYDEALRKLESAKGPAGRRSALQVALERISSTEFRDQLLLEASKIEVDAVLEKTNGLKTVSAKRRRLQEALDGLKNDAVPDELQVTQIRWLQEALEQLETSTSNQP